MTAVRHIPQGQGPSQYRRPLVIGLVNNASGSALQSTEARFSRLLRDASPDFDILLRLFRCPHIACSRGEQGDAAGRYADITELFRAPLDGLIVTGMEPQQAALEDEPIWASLKNVADWAEDQGIPTIWSCLAAHAAVRHFDGIARSRFPEKLLGIFKCDVTAADHPLMRGIPRQLTSPHSRYYGLREDWLTAAGYQILSISPEVGVDVFFKCRAAPFLFLQGHPEYDPDTLLREYRRDVRRYVAGTRTEQPVLPKHYFDGQTEAALCAPRQRLVDYRDAESMDTFFKALDDAPLASGWSASATRLCANWLDCVNRQSLPGGVSLFAPGATVGSHPPELAHSEATILQ